MELNIAEGQVIYIKRLSSKEKVPMFLIKKMLAHGGFGGVYTAKELTRDRELVLKMESHKAKHPQLEIEKEIYSLIYERKTQLIPHFAMFHRFQQKVKLDFVRENHEKESHLFNLLAMEKLGPNLYRILKRSKHRKFHNDEARGKFRDGLSLKYESDGVFMQKEAKYCTGTDSYMSLHVQASRRNPSLRDDCISLC
ncbi:unnamed protein product [Oikopleura dioica]|uniref:Protein kinase domain-containing protein n=1 Tax=Oikopleura dioica TaxID=34765 RepID=E4XWH6_OIKDI|nr:unnamed protein product [Oikopleura dioica]